MKDSFSLKFIGEEFILSNEKVNDATIIISNFSENMSIPLTYWNKKDYQKQWNKAISDLLNKKIDTALITKMYNPKYANFVELWILYFDNDIVHIQNTYLFLDALEKNFNEKDFYSLIPAREILTQEGEKISEWNIDINALKDFINAFSSN